MLLKATKTGLFLFTIMVLVATSGSAPGGSFQGTPTRITIDAGHGGHDPGAVISGVSEKSVNLGIALKVKQLGREHPTLDLVFTRTSDDYVSLLNRLEIAEGNESDGYLSIQANSFHDPGVHGIETIVDKTRHKEGASWSMAKYVQSSIVDRTGARDRGIRYQRLYTRYTSIPSVLVEVGFLSSPSERTNLIDPEYQESIARGIIQGLLLYFSN